MLGRTPGNIIAIRPLREGVISDYEMTEKMIKHFIKKVLGFRLFKPNVIICIPSVITEVEERAVIDAGEQAGARRVYLIEEPVAAAIGAGVDIAQPNGNMIVDIGERTAEEMKMTIGCVYPYSEEKVMEVRGRCLMTGLPRTFTVTSSEMMEAFEDVSGRIVEAVHSVLERTAPELVGDIATNGILMTGGGSLVYGFDKLIESKTGIHTRVADDAISCVAYGTGKALDNIDSMQDGTMNLSRRNQMN